MKNNVRYLFPNEQQPQRLLDIGKAVANEVHETHWPSFTPTPTGLSLLYQLRKRVLDIHIDAGGIMLAYSGSDTQGREEIEGRGTVNQNYKFLGQWLDNEVEVV